MLKEKLMQDLKQSMKDKNTIRKNVIQMIRAAILQIEKDKQIELDDDAIIDIMAKEAKKRKDSIPDFEKGGREDLVVDIKEEISIIKEYLPEPLNMEQLESLISDIISDLDATSMKDMGRVMKTSKEVIGARADGKTINDIVRKLLS